MRLPAIEYVNRGYVEAEKKYANSPSAEMPTANIATSRIVE